MIQPVDVQSVHKVTFPGDDDPPTIWYIGPLRSRERAHLADRMALARAGVAADTEEDDLPPGTEVDIRSGTVQRERVALGVKGWEQFGAIQYDCTPHPVLRESRVVRDDLLDKIPEAVFEWLDSQIKRLCELGEVAAGKSSPSSSQRSTDLSPPTAASATSGTPEDGGSPARANSAAPGAATA